MWTKTSKPAPILPSGSRAKPAPMPAVAVRPATRVLQSSRTPQQLSFEFRRG